MPIQRYLSIWGIIAVCAAVFAVERAKKAEFADDYGCIPAKINGALQAIRNQGPSMEAAKPLATLVTAVFLHGSAEHIVYNMLYLWVFGVLVTQSLAQVRTLAIFLLCGICGNLLQVALNKDSIVPIIGASGAISGLEGLYLGLAVRWELPWPDVWPLAHPIPPLQLAALAILGFLGDIYFLNARAQHIAFGAHVGGFLSGLAVAAIITSFYPTRADYWRPKRKT